MSQGQCAKKVLWSTSWPISAALLLILADFGSSSELVAAGPACHCFQHSQLQLPPLTMRVCVLPLPVCPYAMMVPL